MGAWENEMLLADALIDDALGDDLLYSTAGGAFVSRKGYVIDETANLGLDNIDEPLGQRKRVKISKAIIARPARTDRIQHPRLGEGTFQPAAALPDDAGRYWIFDVQKV